MSQVSLAMGFWVAAAGAAVGWSPKISQSDYHSEPIGKPLECFLLLKASRPWPSSQERTAWSPSLIRWRALRCRPWDFQHEKHICLMVKCPVLMLTSLWCRETGELGGKHSMVQLLDFPVNQWGDLATPKSRWDVQIFPSLFWRFKTLHWRWTSCLDQIFKWFLSQMDTHSKSESNVFSTETIFKQYAETQYDSLKRWKIGFVMVYRLWNHHHMGMDQYLLIPFLGEWTSIYQLFWCSPGVQGFDPSPFQDPTSSQFKKCIYFIHIIYYI